MASGSQGVSRRLAVALALVALTALPAFAHPAPGVSGRFVRLLHDFNDDYGGDQAVNDGHDLVALDVETNWSATRRSHLVFRLTMNGGWAPTTVNNRPALEETLRFKVDGVQRDLLFRTTTNLTWTGSCDAYSPWTSLRPLSADPDDPRFYVECTVAYDRIGAVAGSVLSDFRVEGRFGTARGDYMPGGAVVSGNDVPAAPPSEQATPTASSRATFELPKAVSVTAPASVTVPAGTSANVTLSVKELLGEAQAATFVLTAPAGWTATAPPTTLAAGSTTPVVVQLVAAEDAVTGNLSARVDTDRAGKATATIRLVAGPVPLKPPTAPRDLVATAGPARVSLAWTPPATGPVTTYRVEIGQSSPTYTLLGDTTATSRVVDDLQPGATYWFRVAAVNAAGVGPFSEAVTAVPTPRVLNDTAPRIVDVAPVGDVLSRRPTLSVDFADDKGVESADLVLDGVAVTGVELDGTRLTWTPGTDLEPGRHVALVRLRDAAGGTTERSWQFVVPAPPESEPPNLVEVAPSDGAVVVDPFTNVVARFTDASGVDPARVVLAIDGTPVTARVDVLTVSYAPQVAFTEGRHDVRLTLVDTLGNAGNRTWSFTVRPSATLPGDDDAGEPPADPSGTPGAGVALLLGAAALAAAARRR